MVTIDLLRGALKTEPPEPKWLLELARKLRDEVGRGDMMLGLLPPDAEELVAQGLLRAAEAGATEAWLDVGHCFAAGRGVPADPTSARAAFRQAVATGSRDAKLALLAHLYFRMRAPENADEAAALARELLDPDPDGAGHLLAGYMAMVGFGVPADPAESVRLHREAADRGSRSAMFEMYVLLSTGQGVDRDDALALKYCREAAELGHPRAAYNMGAFHCGGLGELISKDIVEGVRWYQRASDLGNGRASAMLGYMHLLGDGVELNEDTAQACFEIADAQGFDVAGFLESLGVEAG